MPNYDYTGLNFEFVPKKTVNGNTVDMTREEVEEIMALRYARKIDPSRIRKRRDEKLFKIDAIVTNPLRVAALEAADPTAMTKLATLRQALLDIPQQPGFPENVVWPEEVYI